MRRAHPAGRLKPCRCNWRAVSFVRLGPTTWLPPGRERHDGVARPGNGLGPHALCAVFVGAPNAPCTCAAALPPPPLTFAKIFASAAAALAEGRSADGQWGGARMRPPTPPPPRPAGSGVPSPPQSSYSSSARRFGDPPNATFLGGARATASGRARAGSRRTPRAWPLRAAWRRRGISPRRGRFEFDGVRQHIVALHLPCRHGQS